MSPPLSHIFVLMLENRSFDHMLGFSGIVGTDAVTGRRRSVNGLTGSEANQYQGRTYPVSHPADSAMAADPGHEFTDTVEQLCGPTATYPPSGSYPPINNSGFVADYAAHVRSNAGAIMKCFSPDQLPVLTKLASTFAVCDSWFASIPGPTFPNRFFACGASSGGLDHSPTSWELFTWETVSGFQLPHGSIFDALGAKFGSGWRIYAGDNLPMATALKNIHHANVTPYASFANDVANANYPWLYTWIEPNYGDVPGGTYKGGNSQHPLDGVTAGEALIKSTYEAIRNSPHWATALLIITWDEHGGFYDHVIPPRAVPPGDTQPGSKYNQFGFTFAQYGVRVPAVVVSPLIPPNVVDGRLYDHATIPATVEAAFGIKPLTARDAAANTVLPLLSLTQPRDCPKRLPTPVPLEAPRVRQLMPRPTDTVNSGNLPGVLLAAARLDQELSPPSEVQAILAKVQSIQTREDAQRYLDEVNSKAEAEKADEQARFRLLRRKPRKRSTKKNAT
ncbi:MULTISPECIES: alkaline phosphatase family protein [Bradyrhizobium]|uniref:Alkaline phosphatase family protein n=2 Tax=Bradyrhizobium TaxID=374 RepID=A0A974AGP6_9BRAD|nr:alkaline phosphatase family protein [Bradyrhizobium quebecense]UGA48876.1 alkaline phosphatase family protein [Bradyrhizobium quebecense]